jgi:hypothetical protein
VLGKCGNVQKGSEMLEKVLEKAFIIYSTCEKVEIVGKESEKVGKVKFAEKSVRNGIFTCGKVKIEEKVLEKVFIICITCRNLETVEKGVRKWIYN